MKLTNSLESVVIVSEAVGCSRATARERIKKVLSRSKRHDCDYLFKPLGPRKLLSIIVKGKRHTSHDVRDIASVDIVTARRRMEKFSCPLIKYSTKELFAPPYSFRAGQKMGETYKVRKELPAERIDPNSGIPADRIMKLESMPRGSWEEANL